MSVKGASLVVAVQEHAALQQLHRVQASRCDQEGQKGARLADLSRQARVNALANHTRLCARGNKPSGSRRDLGRQGPEIALAPSNGVF